MASTASVSGLASGLDTATIVSQLMQIEAQPQSLLKKQLTATQADAAAYRDVNTAFAALSDAAKKLTQAATWSAAKATTSSTNVAATASSTAAPGSLTFSVTHRAATHVLVTDEDKTGAWTHGSRLTVTGSDTVAHPVDLTGVTTMAGVAKAINATAGTGVTATVVNTGTGQRLQLTATTSGQAAQFTVSTPDSATFTKVATGTDAELSVGGAYTVTSKTNTFDGVLAGVSFTLGSGVQEKDQVTVSVASDPDAVTTAVQAMVTAANAVVDKISKNTDSSTGSTAALKGDFDLTNLAGQLLTAVSSAVGKDGSVAKAGLQTDRYGKLTFDATAFKAALATDPSLAQRLFAGTPATTDSTGQAVAAVPGVATRLQTLADRASNSTTGTLVGLAKSEDDQAKALQKRIDDWDTRLAARQATLSAQFTAMETALSTLKNQSSWLSSQLSTLTSNSSKS